MSGNALVCVGGHDTTKSDPSKLGSTTGIYVKHPVSACAGGKLQRADMGTSLTALCSSTNTTYACAITHAKHVVTVDQGGAHSKVHFLGRWITIKY